MKVEEKHYFMNEAIKEAKKAKELDEVPIGAIIVKDGEIIGRGYNLRETSHNATTHAEMIAIQAANKTLENWRLEDCEMFVTLEPCAMCSGAIQLSRLKKIYFGPTDPKAGAAGTLVNLLQDDRFNHQVEIESGVLKTECREMLTSFFKELREKKKIQKLNNRKN